VGLHEAIPLRIYEFCGRWPDLVFHWEPANMRSKPGAA
jgi:hypothetical protein